MIKSKMRPKKPRMKNLRQQILPALTLTVWVGISVVAGQLIVGVPLVWLLGEEINNPVWMTVYTALAYLVGLLICILIPAKLFKQLKTSREELGLLGFPTWTDIGLAPIGFIVYLIGAAIITAAFSIFPWFIVDQAQDTGFNNLFSAPDRIVAFISLAIIAPIAEEIIFRGWLYGKLRAKLSMPIAMLLVSVLFGILHGQWNVGVNVFAMSLVLCGLREITGTIWSGILLHIIKNAIAFYLLYVIM